MRRPATRLSPASCGLAAITGIVALASCTIVVSPPPQRTTTITIRGTTTPSAPSLQARQLWTQLLSLVKQHNDHVSRQDVEAALEVRFRDPDSSKPTAGMAALPVYQETRPGLGLFTATVEDNATTNRVLMRWGLDLPGQAHCIDPALAERDLLALGWRPSGHMSAQGGTMLQFSRPPGGNSAQAPKASRRQPGTVVGIILPPRQTRCMAGFMIDVRQQTGLQQSSFTVPGGFGRDGSFLGRQPGQIFERGGIKGFIKAGTVPRNAELNPNP